MARARNIKPAVMDNEQLAELPALTRLLFIYLWMLADREGRLEDLPKRIAKQALGYDRDADIETMLNQLERSGFIRRYQASGVKVILIVNFAKHQNPHGTEKDSGLPDENGMLTVHTRGKHGYASGESQLINATPTGPPQSENSALTVNQPSLNPLIPDSLIPDSLIAVSTDTGAVRAVTLKVADLVAEGVDPKHAADWLKVRKDKRAPLTQTAWDAVKAEATKAGMTPGEAVKKATENSWQGFKADWLITSRIASSKPTRHTGFDAKDYMKGVNPDGSLA